MLVFPNASLDFGAPPLQTIVVYHILHIVWAPRWWWWCSAAQSCPTLCSPMDCSTSLSPRVCSDLCPLDQWYHPTISSSATPFSSCLQSFPASESFFNESTLCIRWPKYWSFSFSISPSSEYLGLISSRMICTMQCVGSNQQPLQWKCGVLTTGPPGKSLCIFYFNKKNLF